MIRTERGLPDRQSRLVQGGSDQVAPEKMVDVSEVLAGESDSGVGCPQRLLAHGQSPFVERGGLDIRTRRLVKNREVGDEGRHACVTDSQLEFGGGECLFRGLESLPQLTLGCEERGFDCQGLPFSM